MKAFTVKGIDAIKPSEKVQTLRDPDPRYKGLYLRVTISGVKSWYYVYRYAGKKVWYLLGRYPDLKLAKARERWQQEAGKVAYDRNPADERRQERREHITAPTVKDLAGEYLNRWAKPRKASWQEDERFLEKEILPAWGQRKAKSITRRDIHTLLDGIIERGSPVTANRTLSLLNRMFNFAVDRDSLSMNPAHRIGKPHKEIAKDRSLTTEEIREFWLALDSNPLLSMPELEKDTFTAGEAASLLGISARAVYKALKTSTLEKSEVRSKTRATLITADSIRRYTMRTGGISEEVKRSLRLILVTGQRPGEIVGMAWSEKEDGWWTIPADRTKNRRPHRIPLSPLALSIIGESKFSPFVFPSPADTGGDPKAAKHLARSTLSQALKRSGCFGLDPFTPHDLRRTAATQMASLGIPRFIVGQVLSHTEGSITATYDRYAYDQEKKEALLRWSRQLEELVGLREPGERVVDITQKKGQ